jgi:hypothetical protein
MKNKTPHGITGLERVNQTVILQRREIEKRLLFVSAEDSHTVSL